MKLRTEQPLPLALLRMTLGFLCFTHGFATLFLGQRAAAGGWLAALGVPQPQAIAWALALLEFIGGPLLMAGLLVVPLTAAFLLLTALGMAFGVRPRAWFASGASQASLEHGVLLLASLACLLLSARAGRGRG